VTTRELGSEMYILQSMAPHSNEANTALGHCDWKETVQHAAP